MSEDELEEMLTDCPRLYHMAAKGSWFSIKENGLLSTSGLLDLYKVEGKFRSEIESKHRPNSIVIKANNLVSAVVRDQKPMSDGGLMRCLQDGLTPEDWYRNLNSKVFFWLTEDRLFRLLGARAYREIEHDVLVVDSRSLVDANRSNVQLCPINSGCTKPFPHPRGLGTFQSIPDYPYAAWKTKRGKGERVVELCVEGGVKDISDHIVEVRRMCGQDVKEVIFPS